MFFDVLHVQNRHGDPPLSEVAELALNIVEQDRQNTHKGQIKHGRIEQRPHNAGGFHIGLARLDQLRHRDNTGKGGILYQRNDLVGHGGNNALDHLQQRDLEKYLSFGHAQYLPGYEAQRAELEEKLSRE